MSAEKSMLPVEELITLSTRILDDKKGRDIVCLDLSQIHSYLEYFVIVTGNSRVHCRSLAAAVQEFMKEKGGSPYHSPEIDSGWIVLDYVDIVFHIFLEEERDYYNLEKLWSDAEVITHE